MLNLLFPKVCNGCDRLLLQGEGVICSRCRHDLPLACHHRTESSAMRDIFYGRVPVASATALFYYQKEGLTQHIMHNLKYRGQQEIGTCFGEWLGSELKNCKSFRGLDLVIPVPLHKKKLRKRGYNQVEGFARALSKSLGISYEGEVLIKITSTESQVFKKRLMRIQDRSVFAIRHPERILNKNLLLVDDIVTTGATLESCTLQLLKGNPAKVSIATMAIA